MNCSADVSKQDYVAEKLIGCKDDKVSVLVGVKVEHDRSASACHVLRCEENERGVQ